MCVVPHYESVVRKHIRRPVADAIRAIPKEDRCSPVDCRLKIDFGEDIEHVQVSLYSGISSTDGGGIIKPYNWNLVPIEVCGSKVTFLLLPPAEPGSFEWTLYSIVETWLSEPSEFDVWIHQSLTKAPAIGSKYQLGSAKYAVVMVNAVPIDNTFDGNVKVVSIRLRKVQ